MRYFFYGSLMDPDVLALVLGRPRRRTTPAAAEGWRRLRVAGECYPLIVPDPDGHVAGVVAEISPAEARRLAWYEGEDYELGELAVTLGSSGSSIAALAFLPNPDLAHAGEPWDPLLWRREHKAALLEAAGRWMAFEGRRPANLDAAWRTARRRAR